MSQQHPVSAFISAETRRALGQCVETYGVSEGYLVEMALRYHLRALRELPQDAMGPPRLVVTRETGEWVVDLHERPQEPTEAMRALHERVRAVRGLSPLAPARR